MTAWRFRDMNKPLFETYTAYFVQVMQVMQVWKERETYTALLYVGRVCVSLSTCQTLTPCKVIPVRVTN
jgi:hypothetical protein